ncbi:type II toxin-antitoxin system VapC family toxin [Thermofilum pendens]|uniref:PIN domain-containing protein n=1 Tax=Thermofilum pendens (strain DSM 2475 / Hrk 5) TaxID=368408 RepID=A1RW80_THEPD|nr:type II toxin-antitoxin system VapC family toxin [Thermofilum pendens]ABL77460.1 conserved hypothetical protein [Thermofilum pendens Hrk 5]
MREAVVDASVVVKWFVEEEGSDKALKVRDMYVEGEVELVAPELLVYEVLNALYYKRLFSEEEMAQVLEALEAYSFKLYPLKGEYARKALEISYRCDVTVYDASYVALAVLRDTYVYTADEKLARRLGEPYSGRVKLISSL